MRFQWRSMLAASIGAEETMRRPILKARRLIQTLLRSSDRTKTGHIRLCALAASSWPLGKTLWKDSWSSPVGGTMSLLQTSKVLSVLVSIVVCRFSTGIGIHAQQRRSSLRHQTYKHLTQRKTCVFNRLQLVRCLQSWPNYIHGQSSAIDCNVRGPGGIGRADRFLPPIRPILRRFWPGLCLL